MRVNLSVRVLKPRANSQESCMKEIAHFHMEERLRDCQTLHSCFLFYSEHNLSAKESLMGKAT